MAATPDVRTGQGDVKLSREEFERRLRERFYDPLFDAASVEIGHIVDAAWKAYDEYHKSPRVREAGPGFANPVFTLPVEWLDARDRIHSAERQHRDPAGRSRVLLVAGAARHDQTCPGEMSKTFRLAQLAREEIERSQFTCDLLDLSLLTAQYGRQILPCKACVSTAMPLCHWPCSCYPNHAMGQVNDWMKRDLSHVGGGPRHHDCHACLLVPGAQRSQTDDLHEEVRNAARVLVESIRLARTGQLPRPDRAIQSPRPK